MDCYLIGDDTLAEMHARELLRKTTNPDGSSGLPIAAPRPASRSISSRPAWRPRTRDQPRQRGAGDQPAIQVIAPAGSDRGLGRSAWAAPCIRVMCSEVAASSTKGLAHVGAGEPVLASDGSAGPVG
jgi:hypothetical protein